MSSLEEQLRSLSDENGRLMKLLGEKDYEIKKLKRKNAVGADVGMWLLIHLGIPL